MTKSKQVFKSYEPLTSGVRSNTVDIVKGIATILVVYGHTVQGMVHREWWNGPKAAFSDALIYSFHMPVFFFVAGLFVPRSIAKRGSRRFTMEKIKTILYPYILFGILGVVLDPFISQFKVSSQQFHWNAFLLNLADGEASWFLFTLFLCLMIALLTRSFPAWLRFSIAALIGVFSLSGPPIIHQTSHEFCFLALGMWVGDDLYRMDRISPIMAAASFVLISLFQAAVIYRFGPASRWTYIELGVTGTAALFAISRLIEHLPIGSLLAWIGRASLAVFLLSAYVQGATREALLNLFHTRGFWLQLLAPTLLATLIPVLLWHHKDRWRLGWLFQWPF